MSEHFEMTRAEAVAHAMRGSPDYSDASRFVIPCSRCSGHGYVVDISAPVRGAYVCVDCKGKGRRN